MRINGREIDLQEADEMHVQNYLDEYVFRFNRRDTESPAPRDGVASFPVDVFRRRRRDGPGENAAPSPDAPISDP